MRPKYVRIANPEAAPIVATLPEKLLERGMLAPGLLAHITVSKYADHLPLYRQEQIYQQRHQVGLSRQTMANGVSLVAEWLRVLWGHDSLWGQATFFNFDPKTGLS